jgi:dipeptidyl aminopeptidase/acylaminoacyl peptidase
VGDSDGLANADVMSQRVDAMRSAGLDVDFTVYPNLGHGFAVGHDTSAEGWLPLAISFWEKYIGNG